MAKPEWGTKRTCGSCGARFYDLRRQPITCPKCDAVYEDEAPVRSRRSRPPAPERKPKAAPVIDDTAALEDDTSMDDTDLEDGGVDDDDDEKGGDMIEDASDLGEDDEDMAEVIEHLDSDKHDD